MAERLHGRWQNEMSEKTFEKEKKTNEQKLFILTWPTYRYYFFVLVAR